MRSEPLPGEVQERAASEYYADPEVRERIREYCGIAEGAGSRCLFLCARGGAGLPNDPWERSPRYPPEELDALLDRGAEVTRSLWDATNLLFHIDVDYLNPDRPDEAFSHTAETFFMLEATRRAVVDRLAELEIETLEVVTGEGYHFTGRVPLDRPVVRRLAELVPAPPRWFATQAARRPDWLDATVSETQARAFSGLGLVCEFLAHDVIRQAAPHSTIPVVLNGTIVGGGGPLGRECASIDLTPFADPLDVRHVRTVFSVYRKPGVHSASARPLLVTLPRGDPDLVAFLEAGRGARHAQQLARETRAMLPDCAAGVGRLLDAYLRSPLAAFHREFVSALVPPGRGAELREQLDPTRLPPCVVACLLMPNDLLLRPAHLQNLTRALLVRDWTPREILDLVEAIYTEDHDWGDTWERADPRTRAEGYVRAFAGMVHVGLDQLTDFNCVSTQEKGMCPGGGCPYDLSEEAKRLLARSPT